ncbi:hypothetical protein [Dyella sp. Tek66A03]|jgi:hypothetical protein|uniref:hypothetical protein n=1 Tax=Dyella sp. Tek66A03 TaxID=3458298 RepID=UPI00403E374E
MVHAAAPATLKGLVENELHSVAGASVALSELGRSVTTDSDSELEIGGFEPAKGKPVEGFGMLVATPVAGH